MSGLEHETEVGFELGVRMKTKQFKLALFPSDLELVSAWLYWGMQKLEPSLETIGLKWKLRAEYMWHLNCFMRSEWSSW